MGLGDSLVMPRSTADRPVSIDPPHACPRSTPGIHVAAADRFAVVVGQRNRPAEPVRKWGASAGRALGWQAWRFLATELLLPVCVGGSNRASGRRSGHPIPIG